VFTAALLDLAVDFFGGLSPKKHRNSMGISWGYRWDNSNFVHGTSSSIVEIYFQIPFSNFLGIHMYM
jgi:hypothetical protein